MTEQFCVVSNEDGSNARFYPDLSSVRAELGFKYDHVTFELPEIDTDPVKAFANKEGFPETILCIVHVEGNFIGVLKWMDDTLKEDNAEG